MAVLVSFTLPFLRLLCSEPLFPFLDLFYKPLFSRRAYGNFQVWFLLPRLCCIALFFAARVSPVLLFYTLRGSVVWFVAVPFLTIYCHLPVHIFVQLDMGFCVLVLVWWVFMFGSTPVGIPFCSVFVWLNCPCFWYNLANFPGFFATFHSPRCSPPSRVELKRESSKPTEPDGQMELNLCNCWTLSNEWISVKQGWLKAKTRNRPRWRGFT